MQGPIGVCEHGVTAHKVASCDEGAFVFWPPSLSCQKRDPVEEGSTTTTCWWLMSRKNDVLAWRCCWRGSICGGFCLAVTPAAWKGLSRPLWWFCDTADLNGSKNSPLRVLNVFPGMVKMLSASQCRGAGDMNGFGATGMLQSARKGESGIRLLYLVEIGDC